MRGSTPLCMDQFSKLFTTCRIAAAPFDKLRRFEATDYAVVISNAQFYKVQLVDEHGNALSAAQLSRYD